MSFTRRIVALGLALAVLSAPTARAQEAAEAIDLGQGEVVIAEYIEAPAPEEWFEVPVEVPAEPVEMPSEPVAEPIAMPAPVVVPTLAPTPVPTATPVATVTAAPVASGKLATTVIDNRFQPNTLTVAVGTTVTWTNNGFNFHTLSSTDKMFDSGPLGAGQSFSYTFQKAGTIDLICRQHVLNGMTGRIIVQ
jgi:plastocyanin